MQSGKINGVGIDSRAIYISIISQLYCKNSAYYGVRQFSYPPSASDRAGIYSGSAVRLSVCSKVGWWWKGLITQRRRYDYIFKVP